MEQQAGIYRILNQINGKFYIGSSVRLEDRRSRHWTDLRKQRHPNLHLQRAFIAYGEAAFTFEVLEILSNDKLILMNREQFYMDQLQPEYNMAPKAYSCLGVTRSKETRLKMSQSASGRQFSESHRQAISATRKGKRLSEKQRAAIIQANKGRVKTEEEKEKLRRANRGRIFSAETRERMSIAQKRRGGPDATARDKAAATRLANAKQPQECMICGIATKSIRKRRCHACNEYWRRNAEERPWPPVQRDASICRYGHDREKEPGKSGCKTCCRNATRRYRLRQITKADRAEREAG